METSRGRVRRAGAAAMIVALVFAGCADGDEEITAGEALTLPIGPPGFGAGQAESTMTTMWRPFDFVAVDDLPSLGGPRQGYRVVPDPDAMDLVAERLGVEPVTTTDSWTAHDEPILVDLDGAWSLWSPGLSGAVSTCDSSGECSDNSAETPTGTTKDQAETAAEELLKGIGLDLASTMSTTASSGSWEVTIRYELDGREVPGLVDRVRVGDDAEIVGGFGFVGAIEPLDEYPTVDTATALKRLNESWFAGASYSGGTESGTAESAEIATEPVPADRTMAPPDRTGRTTTTTAPPPPDSLESSGSSGDGIAVPPSHGPTTTTILSSPPSMAPGAPPTTGNLPAPNFGPPPTTTVTFTSVEWTVVPAPGWDGSGIYLVPAYLFTADDGQTRTVVAVADDVIEGQPAQDSPPITPGPPPETTIAPTTTGGG